MSKSKNVKLASNIILMFLIQFVPKIFGFFLVPVYTAYLSIEEYGISDLIINTASIIIPFVPLVSASAVLRFTIEDKANKKPLQIALRIFAMNMMLLLIGMIAVHYVFNIQVDYLFFIYIIVGTAILSDIFMSYTKALECMKIVAICGIGSSLVSLTCNIFLIVIFKWGVYGFLISSVVGYLFNVFVLAIHNRKDRPLEGIFWLRDFDLQREMLQYSVPLIISGIAWWVVSSSDRYFVTGMCGVAANGVYAVGYKIPTILQTLYGVFSGAWVFTLYDCYNTHEGRQYIAKVYDFYSFMLCATCSLLITMTIPLAKLLYSNDFFDAWRYTPPLLLSVMFLGLSSFMGGFLAVYKKTKISAKFSFINAICNIVLNYILIVIIKDAMGAAVATAITFFVSWCLNYRKGVQLSHVEIKIKKQLFIFALLVIQSVLEIKVQSMVVSAVFFVIILIINIENIKLAMEKAGNIINKVFKPMASVNDHD